MVRPTRNASASIRSARRSATAGSSSASSVSASSASAPTGVLSSWLMLATKSRRTASSRRRSVTSSIDGERPETADALRAAGIAVRTSVRRGGPNSSSVRGGQAVPRRRRQLRQLDDRLLDERVAVPGRQEARRDSLR